MQLARLTQRSQIEFAKENPEDPLKQAKFKNSLTNIRDTNWSHTDPIWTLQAIGELDKFQISKEVVWTSGLATATLFPFVVLFPELCYEVGRHANLKDRALYDTDGNKILYFSPRGIEEAFKWSSEGVTYMEKDSLEYYEKSPQAASLIRDWLEEESKGFTGNKLLNVKR